MSTLKKLITIVESHNVCIRCKWRLFRNSKLGSDVTQSAEVLQQKWIEFKSNLNEDDLFDKNDDLNYASDNIEISNKSIDSTSNDECTLCLGMLSKKSLDKMKTSIADCVNGKNYFDKTTPYSFFITLPLVTVLRQASFMRHVEQQCKDKGIQFDEELAANSLPLKESIKYCIIPDLNIQLDRIQLPESSLTIHAFINLKEEEICNDLVAKFKSKKQSRKRKRDGRNPDKSDKASAPALQNILDSIASVEDFNKLYPCPPEPSRDELSYSAEIKTSSVYFGGRYRKLSRKLSQTPWILDGVRHGTTSVQELICEHIQTATGAEELKFMSSGREDVDVRMLGNGRPFAVQFINPRKVNFTTEELTELEKKINSSTSDVEVLKLQIIDKEELTILKEGEESKKKLYSATILVRDGAVNDETIKPLNLTEELILDQRTPLRVLHRRPNAIRSRAIYSMVASDVNDNQFTLQLTTQAGTYIKEFVHGDFGRTKPSIGDLISKDVDIIALDVEGVELEWPPFANVPC